MLRVSSISNGRMEPLMNPDMIEHSPPLRLSILPMHNNPDSLTIQLGPCSEKIPRWCRIAVISLKHLQIVSLDHRRQAHVKLRICQMHPNAVP